MLTLKHVDPDGVLAGDPRKIMILDTETTGLKVHDRIIQFSAVDGLGTTLVNEKFKPEGVEAWPDAERVNGISPAMVANCRMFRDVAGRCREMMSRMDAVAGWNLKFDLKMMRQSGVEPPQGPAYIDLMQLLPDLGPGSRKLEPVSTQYGFDPGDCPRHNALVDVWATLHAFCGMLQDRYLTPPAHKVWQLMLHNGGNCGMRRNALLAPPAGQDPGQGGGSGFVPGR